MLKRLIIIIFILNLFILPTYAVENRFDYYKDKIRNTIGSLIGDEMATKLFGPAKLEITLPKIPEIVKDAKIVTEVVEDKNHGAVPKDQRRKYDYIYVSELYQAIRGQEGADIEIGKWINILDQGATREGVYRSLVLDSSYAALEGSESPVNDSLIQFSTDFMKTYINQKVDKKTLEKVNFYTLKRIMVEKTLDVVDLLSYQNNDLLSWYAVFSSELAIKYPNLWQGKIRKEISRNVHYEWGEKVPRQHIKGEIIIKLNKVFNYLM